MLLVPCKAQGLGSGSTLAAIYTVVCGSPGVVSGPAASTSPGTCDKCRFSGPIPHLLTQDLWSGIQQPVF